MENCLILGIFEMNSSIIFVVGMICLLLFSSSSYGMNMFSSEDNHNVSNGWNHENITEVHLAKRHSHGRCVRCSFGLFKCCEPDICVKHTLGRDKCKRIKVPH
jgi:hypothetical protein